MDVKNFVSAFGWEIPIYMQRIATKLSKEFLLSNTQRPWCLVANCSHRLYYPRVCFLLHTKLRNSKELNMLFSAGAIIRMSNCQQTFVQSLTK